MFFKSCQAFFLFFFEIVIYPTKTVDEYRGKHGLKRSELLASTAEQYMASAH